MAKWTLGFALMLALVGVMPTMSQEKKEEPAAPELKSTKDKVSYGVGLNIGRTLLKQQLDDADVTIVARGIADALAKRKPALSQEEIEEAFDQLQEQIKLKAKLAQQKNKEE